MGQVGGLLLIISAVGLVNLNIVVSGVSGSMTGDSLSVALTVLSV